MTINSITCAKIIKLKSMKWRDKGTTSRKNYKLRKTRSIKTKTEYANYKTIKASKDS